MLMARAPHTAAEKYDLKMESSLRDFFISFGIKCNQFHISTPNFDLRRCVKDAHPPQTVRVVLH